MIALSAIAVALRLVSRRLSKVRLWWDDWLILIALVNDPRANFFRTMPLTLITAFDVDPQHLDDIL